MHWYLALKHSHITLVGLSLSLFVLRGLWMLSGSPRLQQRWVRVLPHMIDTALLGFGVALAVLIPFNPAQHPWLAAKLVALVLYIALGMLTFKAAQLNVRRSAFAGALLCAAYMVSAAITKNALPWQAL